MGVQHPKYKVAVVQAAPVWLDLDATVDKTISLIDGRDRFPFWTRRRGSIGRLSTSETVVGDDEGSTGPQPPMHLGQRASAFVFRNEVERQEAGRRIERSDGRAIDIAFMEVDARGEWTESAPGRTQPMRSAPM